MKTISEGYARRLLDFAPTAQAREMGFGESQLHGSVAAYNMLARNGVAYLADEVGMGKTYVALGVAGLLRYMQPASTIMIITPSENIQRKWIKELLNFVRLNWKIQDNRVKGLDDRPVYEPLVCGSIEEIGRAAQVSADRDLVLRMTCFSRGVKSSDSRKRNRKELRRLLPWVNQRLLKSSDPWEFRDAYGRILNALIPDIDLLIVDEAHNLRHGFGPRVSNRNRILGFALGHPDGAEYEDPWYRPRVKRALLLSATPFEYDYADIHNQLDVLGLGNLKVTDTNGTDPIRLRKLADPQVPVDEKREIISRVLLRRVSYLRIANKKYSKNMYRREWRQGGLTNHDDPMALSEIKQRLVVGLIQKKVAEIIGDKQFNNHFQIGMLSSFESFLETVAHRREQVVYGAEKAEEDEDEGQERIFEGQQEATTQERRGIDTLTLDRVIKSYRERFGVGLPHPKLDATATALSSTFDTGEKALIFVRRVATVSELKAKLDNVFDEWIQRRMRDALPGLQPALDDIFHRYRAERRRRGTRGSEAKRIEDPGSQVSEELIYPFGDDEGGTDSFFAWFFRGDGPKDVLSGAAFQKNRLSSTSSLYGTLFEDDYVSWLLGRPEDPLRQLSQVLGQRQDHLERALSELAYGYFVKRTTQAEGFPRLYVFESYQVAALQMLAELRGELADRASTVLHERFGLAKAEPARPPDRYPGPETVIGASTFFTELVRRSQLREAIWPDDRNRGFAHRLRDRERRRELISAMARLGATYIDLYLLAIRRVGSFELGGQAEEPPRALATDFLDLLEEQSGQLGFHSFYELSSAAAAFDTIVAVNSPEVHHSSLSDLATIYGRTLQRQVPVGRMFGGVNKRLVRQFRMPGFPLVLVTTDVLQQGEDLHTFCQKVIHYGITWTPSAMEQRTGRVDRIGSLVQRNLDGRDRPPEPHELIQVYVPHLQDTVEVFQVRRVLQRLNKFLQLIHRTRPKTQAEDSRVDVAREILNRTEEIPRIEGLLESAFPVRQSWLQGKLTADDVVIPDITDLEKLLKKAWRRLLEVYRIEEVRTSTPRRRAGVAYLKGAKCVRKSEHRADVFYRQQPFELELRSEVMGSHTLIRCMSPVGVLDLSDRATLDHLYELQYELGMVKVCVSHDVRRRRHRVSVQGHQLFNVKTTQLEEIERLVRNTVEAADCLEQTLLEDDAEATEWLKRDRDNTDG